MRNGERSAPRSKGLAGDHPRRAPPPPAFPEAASGGADIAPGVGAGRGAVLLGRGDDVVVRQIPNRVPVPLN